MSEINYKPFHIIYRGSLGWAVVRSGARRALRVLLLKSTAKKLGKTLAKRLGLPLYIHGKDGRVQAVFNPHPKIQKPARPGTIHGNRIRAAVRKVLYDRNNSKAEKTKRGSALCQR